MDTSPVQDPTPVRRCVCFGVTFEDLKQSGIATVEEAGQRFGCGTKCGMCRRYIAEMLRTGETAFAVLSAGD